MADGAILNVVSTPGTKIWELFLRPCKPSCDIVQIYRTVFLNVAVLLIFLLLLLFRLLLLLAIAAVATAAAVAVTVVVSLLLNVLTAARFALPSTGLGWLFDLPNSMRRSHWPSSFAHLQQKIQCCNHGRFPFVRNFQKLRMEYQTVFAMPIGTSDGDTMPCGIPVVCQYSTVRFLF